MHQIRINKTTKNVKSRQRLAPNIIIFAFMELADAFMQSHLHLRFTFDQFTHSLVIKPMTYYLSSATKLRIMN